MRESHSLLVKLQLFPETFLKGAQTAHTFLEKTYNEKVVTLINWN